MRIKLQKIRAGTKYESYRLSIPKAIVKLYKLDDYDFDMKFIDGKIVLSLVEKRTGNILNIISNKYIL